MKLYAILRRSGWASPEELERGGRALDQVGDEEMPDEVRWIRSYVLEENGGSVGTICIYEATGPEAIRKHASRADLPVDEIVAVADTVVVRPDPVADRAAGCETTSAIPRANAEGSYPGSGVAFQPALHPAPWATRRLIHMLIAEWLYDVVKQLLRRNNAHRLLVRFQPFPSDSPALWTTLPSASRSSSAPPHRTPLRRSNP